MAVLFGITKRKDAAIYSLYLLLQAIYFFVNAPYTFFKINDNVVFDSTTYIYLNTPLVIVTNLAYVYFLKIFFSSIYRSRQLNKLVLLITVISPCLIAASTISIYLLRSNQYIFYTVNLVSALFSIYLLIDIKRKKIKNVKWISTGMVFNIIGNMATVAMIVLGQFGYETMLTIGYPLLFMRLGILFDMAFYQVAIIQKWGQQEKELALQEYKTRTEVERVRHEISRELHDDIGATLSGIHMYSHMAMAQTEKNDLPSVHQSVQTIQQSAAEMVNKLKDIVWMNNTSDKEGFTERLKDYVMMMVQPAGITPHYDFSAAETFNRLPADIRYQLYLICKEAVNNAVKHSGAKNIFMSFTENNKSAIVEIRDDGKGFDSSAANGGNGMGNMQKRAEALGGQMQVSSSPGSGTAIRLQVKITR